MISLALWWNRAHTLLCECGWGSKTWHKLHTWHSAEWSEWMHCIRQWRTHIDSDNDKEFQRVRDTERVNWKKRAESLSYTQAHIGHAVSKNAPYTQALLLHSSMIVLDVNPSLMLTDAHVLSSSHLFIYLFICVKFIYWWTSRIWWQISICSYSKVRMES